jgi:hypothetical protein
VPGDQLYLDISSVKELSYRGSNFWAMIVDNYTGYSWSILLKNKSDLKNKIFTLLTDFKISVIDVEFIRYDDSGKISCLMTHVEQKDTLSSLNSQVQELPNSTVRWNVSFELSIRGLERH